MSERSILNASYTVQQRHTSGESQTFTQTKSECKESQCQRLSGRNGWNYLVSNGSPRSKQKVAAEGLCALPAVI